MITKYITAAAAIALVAAPAMAAPVNPAANLSVAKSMRVGAPTAKKNKLAGTGLILALGAAAVVAGGVFIAVDDDDDDSDSN